MLLRSSAAAGSQRGQLRSCFGMLRTAGAGAGAQHSPAGDTCAVPLPRAPEGSRRSLGARPRHGSSAPTVRSGAGSGASGAGAKPMPAGMVVGGHGRSLPPCLVCAGLIGAYAAPRCSLHVTWVDSLNVRDGLSVQL